MNNQNKNQKMNQNNNQNNNQSNKNYWFEQKKDGASASSFTEAHWMSFWKNRDKCGKRVNFFQVYRMFTVGF